MATLLEVTLFCSYFLPYRTTEKCDLHFICQHSCLSFCSSSVFLAPLEMCWYCWCRVLQWIFNCHFTIIIIVVTPSTYMVSQKGKQQQLLAASGNVPDDGVRSAQKMPTLAVLASWKHLSVTLPTLNFFSSRVHTLWIRFLSLLVPLFFWSQSTVSTFRHV